MTARRSRTAFMRFLPLLTLLLVVDAGAADAPPAPLGCWQAVFGTLHMSDGYVVQHKPLCARFFGPGPGELHVTCAGRDGVKRTQYAYTMPSSRTFRITTKSAAEDGSQYRASHEFRQRGDHLEITSFPKFSTRDGRTVLRSVTTYQKLSTGGDVSACLPIPH